MDTDLRGQTPLSLCLVFDHCPVSRFSLCKGAVLSSYYLRLSVFICGLLAYFASKAEKTAQKTLPDNRARAWSGLTGIDLWTTKKGHFRGVQKCSKKT
jgi:hypothetical protein